MGVSVEARGAGTLMPMINNLILFDFWRGGGWWRDRGGQAGFVETRQALMAVENGEAIIGVMADCHLGLHIMVAMRAGLYLQDFALIADSIVFAHNAFFLQTQNVRKRKSDIGDEGRFQIRCRNRELPIMPRLIGISQICVGGVHCRDAVQRELGGQPTLQRAEHTFRTTSRFGAVGRNVFDAKLFQRATNFRQSRLVDFAASLRRVPIMAASVRVETAENAMFLYSF